MNYKIEVEKEFSSADLHKRVGWIRTAAIPDSELVAVDVVTATVESGDGAEFGYGQWHDEDRDIRSFPSPSQKGLGHVAAFSGFLSNKGNWQEEFNLEYVPQEAASPYRIPKADDLLANGTGSSSHFMEAAEKVWADSSRELLAALKQELVKLNFEDVYEVLYYWINGSIGREYPMRSALTDVQPEALLLPDPAMAGRTHSQLDHVRSIEASLGNSIYNDTAMRHRLTGYADDTPMATPDQFAISRERAAVFEKAVTEEASQLVVKRLAYAPVGHGRGGRTWPYMDAAEPDPARAYGIELTDLRNGQIDRTVAELDREIKELEARRTLAREAIARFTLLNQLEQPST